MHYMELEFASDFLKKFIFVIKTKDVFVGIIDEGLANLSFNWLR